MKALATAFAFGLFLGPVVAPAALAQGAPAAITEQEAHAIAVDAYVYFYSLISIDVTRRQATNVEPGKVMLFGPANMFANAPAFPTADFRAVVRPNFDTLYSSAWLDMTKEPVVVSAPDTGGRYYLLPMLDMWSDVFASPGWRTTGTQAANYLVTPPGWSGTVPEGMTRISAPTPYVWIIGRIKTDGPPDYDAVHKIQAGFKVTLLSDWGKTPRPVEVKIDPSIDMKTPPKVQVDTMPAGKYFAYAAELLKVNPPHITDEPIIAQMKRIGIEPGKSFDIEKVPPAVKKAIEERARGRAGADGVENPDTGSRRQPLVDEYRHDGRLRQLLSQARHRCAGRPGRQSSRGRDLPAQSWRRNRTSRSMARTNTRSISRKERRRRSNAFWSVTLYDADGFQVANSLNRFAVSSWMPFKYNADGSLDLYLQNESPGKDKEANWLPAPKGAFNLTMRLYGPKSEALTGRWNPPPVTRVQGTIGRGAQ